MVFYFQKFSWLFFFFKFTCSFFITFCLFGELVLSSPFGHIIALTWGEKSPLGSIGWSAVIFGWFPLVLCVFVCELIFSGTCLPSQFPWMGISVLTSFYTSFSLRFSYQMNSEKGPARGSAYFVITVFTHSSEGKSAFKLSLGESVQSLFVWSFCSSWDSFPSLAFIFAGSTGLAFH